MDDVYDDTVLRLMATYRWSLVRKREMLSTFLNGSLNMKWKTNFLNHVHAFTYNHRLIDLVYLTLVIVFIEDRYRDMLLTLRDSVYTIWRFF